MTLIQKCLKMSMGIQILQIKFQKSKYTKFVSFPCHNTRQLFHHLTCYCTAQCKHLSDSVCTLKYECAYVFGHSLTFQHFKHRESSHLTKKTKTTIKVGINVNKCRKQNYRKWPGMTESSIQCLVLVQWGSHIAPIDSQSIHIWHTAQMFRFHFDTILDRATNQITEIIKMIRNLDF